MTTIAYPLAARSLEVSDLLKLRRKRGLVATVALLTIGAIAITYGAIELLHVIDAAKHGPAGGIANLGHGAFVLAALGAVAATVVGATVGAGDLEAGVYRELVVTGRSRLRLYVSRLIGGMAFVLPFVAVAYALAAIATVVFAGDRPAPDTHLLITTGLWDLLDAALYYLLAFGVACLTGARSYTIGIVLAWRLAVTPILASISALGIVRELVPGVALQNLTPAALGDAAQQGPRVGMSVAAVAAVLLVWAAAAVAIGAWRDTTRDA